MHIHPDKVYLARTPIDRAEAPFEMYRELAQRTLWPDGCVKVT